MNAIRVTRAFGPWVLVGLVGCAACRDRALRDGGGSEGGAEDAAAPADVLTGAGPWSATSSGGSHVELSVDHAPMLAGAPVTFRLRAESAVGAVTPRSVDLVSPTMPAHGVVRFAVEANDGGGLASIEIPMAGRWAVYVNLDDGADSAEFVFEVGAHADGEHMHDGV